MKNMWKSGIWGVIVGDALGCPVQFETCEQIAHAPVTGMIGYRTFNMPVGTWTDDSALTLALLESIERTDTIDLYDIMNNFVCWLESGLFTPYGFAFDIGRGTMNAIKKYEKIHNVWMCGGNTASDNGNGSIMRIMPAVLYCIDRKLTRDQSIDIVHNVSALTHAHDRAKIACGLYYFMVLILTTNIPGTLCERLQYALDLGFQDYEQNGYTKADLSYFDRLRNLKKFREIPAEQIRTTGYVVDTIEAAVWGLITTDSFEEALLKIVNMGGDADSIAAVAGGLAGLYYGYDAIPNDWLEVIQRRDWIDQMIAPLDRAEN